MKNILASLERYKNPDDLAYELIRIFLGIALFVRGVIFMTNQSAIMELVEQREMDWLLPMIEIHYITLAHLCGGFMMMIGLLTRSRRWFKFRFWWGRCFSYTFRKASSHRGSRSSCRFWCSFC